MVCGANAQAAEARSPFRRLRPAVRKLAAESVTTFLGAQ
jgi:hypothetical protein